MSCRLAWCRHRCNWSVVEAGNRLSIVHDLLRGHVDGYDLDWTRADHGGHHTVHGRRWHHRHRPPRRLACHPAELGGLRAIVGYLVLAVEVGKAGGDASKILRNLLGSCKGVLRGWAKPRIGHGGPRLKAGVRLRHRERGVSLAVL